MVALQENLSKALWHSNDPPPPPLSLAVNFLSSLIYTLLATNGTPRSPGNPCDLKKTLLNKPAVRYDSCNQAEPSSHYARSPLLPILH